MTAYSRVTQGRPWEDGINPRPWLYQTPLDILIKASNGASDFGNKFGQPLISGSVLTFEHEGKRKLWALIKSSCWQVELGMVKPSWLKDSPKAGDRIVVMGGDNYRIGMGGAAVSMQIQGPSAVGLSSMPFNGPIQKCKKSSQCHTRISRKR